MANCELYLVNQFAVLTNRKKNRIYNNIDGIYVDVYVDVTDKDLLFALDFSIVKFRLEK